MKINEIDLLQNPERRLFIQIAGIAAATTIIAANTFIGCGAVINSGSYDYSKSHGELSGSLFKTSGSQ